MLLVSLGENIVMSSADSTFVAEKVVAGGLAGCISFLFETKLLVAQRTLQVISLRLHNFPCSISSPLEAIQEIYDFASLGTAQE